VQRLRAKHLPLLSAITQNDPLMEMETPMELARECGANDRQITYLDKNEQVVHGPGVGQYHCAQLKVKI